MFNATNGQINTDTTFLLWLCTNAKTYAVEDKAYYYYLQRKGSASAEYSFKRLMNELISLDEQLDYFRKSSSMDEYAYTYCANRFYSCSARFVHAYESEDVSSKDKDKYISELKELIITLPDYTNLYRIVPEIFSIVELDTVPAPRINMEFSICRKEVAEWITFVIAFDKKFGDIACYKLEDLLAAYFNKKHKAGAGREILEKEISQIKKYMKWPNKRKKFDVIASKALKRILC